MSNIVKKIQTAVEQTGITKSSIESNVAEIVLGIENGEIDALEMQVFASLLSEVGAQIKKATTPFAFDECEKYGKGEKIKIFGAKVEQGQSVKYSFAGESYDALKAELEEKSKTIKAYEAQAKLALASNQPMSFMVTEDGEQIEVLPAIKQSTDVVKVTIPKE